MSGGWLNYGQWHHRGDVYLNGEAFREKQTAEEVDRTEQTWHCQVDGRTTTICANFGAADPNVELVEINVRECLFMPTITGLKYITVDGFHFLHAAANWAPPVIELQTGAIGPRMGKHWIIENCTVTNARCAGIILGHAPGVDYDDIDAYGDHIVRNNVIRCCGQAGIAGQKGATRSLICGNLIEDTNYRREFGGWETAAIKFHNSVDTVIRGNLIRGVFRQEQGAFGIWIDFGNQGVRITRNIVYNTEAVTLFLEMNHGPTLVDCNVFLEGANKSSFGDENSVIATDVTGLAVKDHPLGATITFSIGDAPLSLKGPLVDPKLVGVFPTMGQTIEDRDGKPITVDTDIGGKPFPRAVPGPLADLRRGENTITWRRSAN